MDENKPAQRKPIIIGHAVLMGLCVCTTAVIFIMVLFRASGETASRYNTALNLTYSKSYAEAIPYWDLIIAEKPEDPVARYYRATCYLRLTDNEKVSSKYNHNIFQALEDIDKAIAYGFEAAKPGDPYFLRYFILDRIASGGEYHQSDLNNIYLLELENLKAADSLGTSLGYPKHAVPSVLFLLDRCEQGWQEIKNLKEYYGLSAPPSSTVLSIEAHGYFCLGQLEKALEYVDRGLSIEVFPERVWLRCTILYLMGNREEALQELNNLIVNEPGFHGYRYYLRALIHYENGDKQLAESDLEIGSVYTWGHGGLRAYVLGRMALDDNNKEAAIEYLQETLSTLAWSDRSMYPKIEQELAELGARPLPDEPELSLFLNATPMPTSVATSKPNITMPLSTYGFPLPPNIKKINMANGTGQMKTGDEPYPYPVLLFQPPKPVSIRSIKSLTFHMQPASDHESTQFEVFLWELKTGEWQMLKPGWGTAQIDRPERFVDSNGEVYIAIRGDNIISIMVENIWVSIDAIGEDGSPVVLDKID